MKLEGKRILLTGASGGIGEALAHELAAQGAHLLLHGRRASALERLRRELPHPDRHQTVTADLGSPHERAQLLQHPALDEGLDVLINNGHDVPYSCQSGECATCLCKLTKGTVEMAVTDGLDPDDAEDGYILGCQAKPTSPELEVEY